MAIVKKSFGKNYLRCYKNEKGKIYSCEQIRKSWDNKVNYVTENRSKNIKGLRQAQLGAVFAIRAHWIVSKEAATVVMPTGTGKTETMITTIVAEQCRRVFILVPSDLLRVQELILLRQYLNLRREIVINPIFLVWDIMEMVKPVLDVHIKEQSGEDWLKQLILGKNGAI